MMTRSIFAKRFFQRWFLVFFILALAVSLSAPGATGAAPFVMSQSPAVGATDVPASGTVTATFSEPMDPATLTIGSFVLTRPVRVSAVAGGYNFTMLLKDNGTVSAWGHNGYGQTTVPTGLSGITAIAAGANHAAALKSDGTVTGWGDNTLGQSTVPGGLSGVTVIAAGGNFTLALKTDGTVVAWGDNSRGQTALPGGLAGISRIAAGSFHALALKGDGTVVAWGDNYLGKAAVPSGLSGVIAVAAGGDHSLALKGDGTVVAWGAGSSGQISVPAGLSGVIAIAAGLDYSLALKNDGSAVSWGDNSHGETVVPAGLSDIAAIAAGHFHVIALKNDGTITSWGDNSCSQTNLPAGLSGVISVAAGDSHVVALKSDGRMFAWGGNSNGQATIPAGVSGITSHAAGLNHTLALNSAGIVAAWGKNDAGQATVPTDLAGVMAVAAGDNHSVALKSDGTIVAWGLNAESQAAVPGGLANVTKIAAGTAHTLALKQDGTVAAWGGNSYNAASIPVGLSGVIAISAAGYHSVALKNDGSLTAWGENSRGQSTVPPDLSGVIAIAAGKSHTVALKSDGTVVAFGDNDLGQIAVPAGLGGVVAIAAGNGYTVAVKNDGTLTSWGDNKLGQSTVPQDPYGQLLATSISYSTGSNSATLTPASALPLATTLTATVNSGVRSLDGIHPLADHSWSFATTATPVTSASPAGGTYSSLQNVTLAANEPATIYYTTNGVTPTTASRVYSGPLPISVTTMLKFFARDMAGNSETPQTALYTIVADTIAPITSASPAGGTYSSLQHVTLAANEPATIYYTTNGSAPNISSPLYAGAIPIPYTMALKFFARDTAGNSESFRTESYTIKQNQTITFGPLPVKTYGGSSFALTATSSSGLPISYTSSNSAVAVVSGATVTIAGAGSATITASQGGDGSYNTAPAVVQPLTINKAAATVTLGGLSAIYDNSPKAATITTVPAGLTVTLTYNGAGAAPTAVGSYTVIGTVSDPNYQGSASGTMTIAKGNQTITFADLPFKTYGDPAFSLNATADSGLPISYTSSNSAVAVVSGTTVTIAGAGSATITASQVGNGNYNPAVAVAQGLTVTKAVITLQAANASRAYGEENPVFSATYSGFVNGDSQAALSGVAGLSTAATPVSPVGSYPVTITADTLAATNYSFNFVNGTLTVAKAGQTITFGILPVKTYGDPSFSLNATASSGLAVSYASSNSAVAVVSGTTVTIAGAGSATITASQVGDGNYNPAVAVAQDLTVTKAVITLQAANAFRAYGEENPVFSATYSGFVNGDSQSVLSGTAGLSTSATTISPVGSYPVVAAAGTLAAANYSFSFVSGTLNIFKAAAAVTLESLSTTYDGTPKGATATTVPAGLSVTFTYNGGATVPTAVASYSVVGTVSDTNYQGSATGTMTIAKGNQTITFEPLPVKTFGDPLFTLNGAADSGLAVSYTSSNPAVATVSGATVTIVGAGTSIITATQSGNGNYNAAAAVVRTLTINKAAATVNFGLLTFTYDGNPKPVTVTTIPAGLAVAITYDGSVTVPIDVGNYTVVATVNNANYQGSATAMEEIAKKSQIITFGPLPVKSYGDAPFTFTASASSNLNLTFAYDPSVATIVKQGKTSFLITISGAGTTIVTATQAGNRNYSDAPPVSQTLIINKAAGTVTLGSLSAIYDNSAKSATATTNPSDLAVAFTYNGSATPPIVAGSYSIIGTINDANYQGSASGTLTIGKAGQAITFGALPDKSYGNPSFSLNGTATSSLAPGYTSSNSAVATISGSTVTIVGVGTTTITASQGGDGNYNAAVSVPQILTVSKGTATVTLGGLSATYNGTARAATAITVPDGLPATLTYNGSATIPVSVGSYTVTATVNDANYEGSATGTLIVDKGAQTIAFAAPSARTYGDPGFNLTAVVDSGLQPSYVSSNPAAATISGITVTIVGVGTTIISASQGGDGNYNPAAVVPQTLTINKGTATVTLGGLSTSYNGTARGVTAATVPGGLPMTVTYNGSATLPVAAGNYTVMATVNSSNYQGSATATMTIAKGAQTITFNPLVVKTVGNAPFTLAATSTSGLAISYSSNNLAVATISGTTVTIVGAGTTTITAAQGGDPNYEAATSVTQTLTANAAPITGGKTALTIGVTTSFFDTLTAAFTAITPGSTGTVKLQAITFAEAVDINISGATISIIGGYDSGFTSATGMTTILGSLTIKAGAIIADKLVIR